MISIILPTYNEAENIKEIVPQISTVLRRESFDWEVVVVDDNSPDGTAANARALANNYPVRIHVRQSEKGLATAVMKGFDLAQGEICVVMDADMSHPVEKIADMIRPIEEGVCDTTVGSRYIPGGGSEDWSFKRRVISKSAGLIARGLIKLSDPTSGFMAIRKSILNGVRLDPVGWKIVLEVMVKTDAKFKEVPIIFMDRKLGTSKLDLKAQKDYFHHLWKLYCYRYPSILQFMKFCLVGFSGLFVDTFILIGLVELGRLDPRFAALFAFLTAVTWNYALNRLWTFRLSPKTKIVHSYVSFVMTCTMGFGVRLGVMHLLFQYAGMGAKPWYVVASFLGILAATLFNFLGSRYVSFSKIFARPKT